MGVCSLMVTFSIFCFICITVYSFSGLVVIAMTIWLRAIDRKRFRCNVDNNSNFTRQIEQACWSKYSRSHDSPLPFYAFVVLSFGTYLLVTIAYSLLVRKRLKAIESQTTNNEMDKKAVWVINAYLIHLVLRILLGIIFAPLHYVFFFSNDFDDESYSCVLSPEDRMKYRLTRTPIIGMNILAECRNDIASKEGSLSIAVIVINSVFAVTAIVELVRILPSCCNLQANAEFVRKFFLTTNRERRIMNSQYIVQRSDE